MSRFFRCSPFLAGLIFIAASCSDDKDGAPLTPPPAGGGAGGQTGGGGTGGSAGTGVGAGAGGASNLDNPGDLPLQPGTGGTSAGAGGTGTGEDPPPAAQAPNCEPPSGTLPTLALEPVVSQGLAAPLFLTVAPGDFSRMFVLEQAGNIRVIKDGELLDEPFLDLTGQITAGGERGLLGLAFHPDYQTNGLFYVHYSANAAANTPTGNGTAVIAEFKVSTDSADLADIASERRLLTQQDGEGNHNGGMLEFGKNGLLYAAFGDGGGGGDNHGAIGNGQNLGTFFGKILRLDVDARGAGEYGIPAGNMTGDGVLPEIWSYGWRNPWRFSFDRCGEGDFYIADVGQGEFEEVDFEPAGAAAGLNYGWRLMEGASCFNPMTNCNPNNDLVLPVSVYDHDVGLSITGGYVYRGSEIPGLRGTYIYADYSSARFFTLRIENGAAVGEQEISDQINPTGFGNNGNQRLATGIASFGMDHAGEMYVLSQGRNTIYKITAAE
jgi:glucose/arabinose dehydrogenase